MPSTTEPAKTVQANPGQANPGHARTGPASRISARRQRRLAAVTLTAGAIAVLGGCASPLHHAVSSGNPASSSAPSATASASSAAKAARAAVAGRREQACASQAAWSTRARTYLQVIYADTGALAADARAGNAPGVRTAGRRLASDAVAAATLPLPVVDAADWKALLAADAAAGSALAAGGTVGAVPRLEAGSSAVSAFTTAVARCGTASTS
jgi:hypothetical protein